MKESLKCQRGMDMEDYYTISSVLMKVNSFKTVSMGRVSSLTSSQEKSKKACLWKPKKTWANFSKSYILKCFIRKNSKTKNKKFKMKKNKMTI
jgi:hypothetical protein